MLTYPDIDPVALQLGPAQGPLVRAHVPARLRRRLAARALAGVASGLRLDRGDGRRPDLLLRRRRHRRRAARLHALLRLRPDPGQPPLGLFAGRIGNFINGELWGHATWVPWAMQLPCVRFPEYCVGLPAGTEFSPALHPSQLYEAGLEGLVLFLGALVVLQPPAAHAWPSRGCFLLLYGGSSAFSVELPRCPPAPRRTGPGRCWRGSAPAAPGSSRR
jgi:hypothetical protein